ncbi:N-acetylmuramoyl-L-alanine amidase [Candidatus Dojkabacteria bacterium]|uniref:N-acetylmuramoyl-L-alanine amidase n=1 Tax=Candidatus Dojkabacteria bacterium TaxID=2099670 RepID=A0A955RLA5_9BACT|nr:N-acetylmuramoyl-L-alanine amidase [Candidatus Dojkabacteria bacterium]
MRKTIFKIALFSFVSAFTLLQIVSPVSARGADITEINPIRSVTNTLSYPVISRHEWGCPDEDPDSPYYCDNPFWYAFRNPISHIVIHHTATSTTATDWNKEINYVWTLHATIRDNNPTDGVQGWTDIGYNYLIDQDGKVYEGRYGGEGANGGHVGGHNVGTAGIALLGNYDTLKVTDPEYQSLKNLLIELFTKYKIDPEEYATDYGGSYQQRLSMHQNWNATACPGGNTVTLFNQLRSEVAQAVKENWRKELEASLCPKDYWDDGKLCKQVLVRSDFTSQLDSPTEIAEDEDGNLYVSGYGQNYLYKISDGNIEKLSGTFFIDEIIKNAVDLEIDSKEDILYVLNSSSEKLVAIDLNTMESIEDYPTGSSPKDVIRMKDGSLYVANADSNTLTKIDPTNNEIETIELDGEYPIYLEKDLDENLYVSFYLSDALTKITNKGKVELYTSGGLLPTAVLPSDNGTFYVINEADGKLMFVDDKEVLHTFADLPYQANSMIMLDDGSLLVTHPYDNAVSKVSSKGYVSTIKDIGKEPFKLFEYDGDIYFLDKGMPGLHQLNMSSQSTIPLTKPIYRFWSPSKSSHFFTGALGEKKEVMDKYDENTWTYENVAFFGLQEPTENALAVHRFWSGLYESHFYTISEKEKNEVIDKYDDGVWKYEGIAYYAYPEEKEGAAPIYRFWSGKHQSHFYTMSASEKDEIMEKFDEETWKYEGIAYYAYPKD